jgi:hypothetical protein
VNAPKPVIILIDAQGDRGVWKKAQHRHHKAIRPSDPPWRPKDRIPTQLDRETLRRRAEEMRRMNRARVEEMLTEARAKLAA